MITIYNDNDNEKKVLRKKVYTRIFSKVYRKDKKKAGCYHIKRELDYTERKQFNRKQLQARAFVDDKYHENDLKQ